MYKVFETDIFLKNLKKAFHHKTEETLAKLRKKVYPELKKNPFYGSNVKKLKNYKPDTWRYRIGDYRFFYEVDLEEKIIYMIAADHRKDCY